MENRPARPAAVNRFGRNHRHCNLTRTLHAQDKSPEVLPDDHTAAAQFEGEAATTLLPRTAARSDAPAAAAERPSSATCESASQLSRVSWGSSVTSRGRRSTCGERISAAPLIDLGSGDDAILRRRYLIRSFDGEEPECVSRVTGLSIAMAEDGWDLLEAPWTDAQLPGQCGGTQGLQPEGVPYSGGKGVSEWSCAQEVRPRGWERRLLDRLRGVLRARVWAGEKAAIRAALEEAAARDAAVPPPAADPRFGVAMVRLPMHDVAPYVDVLSSALFTVSTCWEAQGCRAGAGRLWWM